MTEKVVSFYIDRQSNFSFSFTIRSHGWYSLAPFVLDDENDRLSYVFRGIDGKPVSATLTDDGKRLKVNVHGDADQAGLTASVKRLLRLDENFDEFYSLIHKHSRVSWVRQRNAGRLLRSATVFEDLIKTVCTTNCSWALTEKMVTNLVELLGEPTAGGSCLFPTPAAMAAMPEEFYRDQIRAGYRSPYFVELSQAVAAGEVDPESWLTSDLPTPELKKEMKRIKGVGDYAAENLLKLIGRYDGLALDSWLRAQFYKKHNNGKPCPDKKIDHHYKDFAHWRGLAIWCDMTESWFDENGRSARG